jgi:hypothetical protein
MGNLDVAGAFAALAALEQALEEPQSVPHEESAQHRLFCDERYCIERGPLPEE